MTLTTIFYNIPDTTLDDTGGAKYYNIVSLSLIIAYGEYFSVRHVFR